MMEKEKPKWLKRLENESWQAELIVSGAAIFGSLQLPRVMNNMVESSLVLFPEKLHIGLYLLFIYLFLAINILIVSLIVHFVVRALWIGLIGLNSVFPKGISPESKSYPKHFMDKLIAEFPHDLKYITDLDSFCSVIFAFCSFIVLTFLAITIDVMVFLLLYTVLSDVVSEGLGWAFFIAFIIFISIAGFSVYILNHKKLKETAFARRFQYPIYKWMSIISLHIFRKPITRLSFTFISNLELKKYLGWIGGITLVCMVLFFFQLLDSKLIFMTQKDMLTRLYDRADIAMPENYENTRINHTGRILSAVLESDKISGKTMNVFVPVFSNEDEIMEDLCGKLNADDGLDRDEQRAKSREFRMGCLKQYHQFYFNDSLIQAGIIRYTHPNKGEQGIMANLKTASLNDGLNVLKIVKMKNGDGVFRSMQIPFWFEKEND